MLIEMGRLFEVDVVVFSGLIGYLNLWPLYRKVVDVVVVVVVVVVDAVRVQKSFKNTKTKLNWLFYILSQYFPT
jgi:hypothetical protein